MFGKFSGCLAWKIITNEQIIVGGQICIKLSEYFGRYCYKVVLNRPQLKFDSTMEWF